MATASSIGKERQGGSYLRTDHGEQKGISHRKGGRGVWNARMREIVKTWKSGTHAIPASFTPNEPRKH
ncbi:hypothetical protein K2P56_02385 [Patescibacteria group bacterium]|nr:hypothetical protein [Patescibacteria group bacterium]